MDEEDLRGEVLAANRNKILNTYFCTILCSRVKPMKWLMTC